MANPVPAEFPALIEEKVRFSDTDRQGHVNNQQFSAFLEAGRADVLHGAEGLAADGCFFVLARTAIDFVGELNWPGTVLVGSRIGRIGTSSAAFTQALFQDGRCAAVAESVMVQVNIATRTAAPLTDHARAALTRVSAT